MTNKKIQFTIENSAPTLSKPLICYRLKCGMSSTLCEVKGNERRNEGMKKGYNKEKTYGRKIKIQKYLNFYN